MLSNSSHPSKQLLLDDCHDMAIKSLHDNPKHACRTASDRPADKHNDDDGKQRKERLETAPPSAPMEASLSPRLPRRRSRG